jgi:NDP-sugar pyrophosphorylase family protein
MAGIEVVCSREPEPLGTGGAVKLALARVRGPRFFTLNGDSCCDFDVRRLHATHRENAALATLWLVPVDDTSRYGAVELNRQQEVVRFAEKAGSSGPGLINAGVYLLERRIFDDIDRPAFSLEKDVFPGLVGKELRGVAGAGPFIDIGTPESYRLADQFMKQRGV